MKKLYKILISFSFLFLLAVPNLVSAATTTYSALLDFKDTTKASRETYIAKYNAVYNYLHTTLSDTIKYGSTPLNLSTGNYLVQINASTLSTNTIRIYVDNVGYYSTTRTCSFGVNCVRSYYYNSLYYFNIAISSSFTFDLAYNGTIITGKTDIAAGNRTISSFNGSYGNPNNADVLVSGYSSLMMSEYPPVSTANIYQEPFGVGADVPILASGVKSSPTQTLNFLNLFNQLNSQYLNPSYTYTTEILDNGNVRLDFLFTNYTDTSSLYGFSISNEISGEYYGETNRFSSIFPNTIPLGTSYSIELPYDTFIYVTLAKYNPVEGSDTLYLREIIYTDSIDINNIVFTDPGERYFNITSQTQYQLTGVFKNTKSTDICHYQFSTDIDTRPVSCTDTLNLSLNYNGLVTIYIYDMWGETQYSRRINFLGNSNPDIPYIKYNITQQQIYNIVNWSIENIDYDNTMEYRYSTDNGTTFTEWAPVGNISSYKINIFSNSSVIIMLSNADQSVYYDTKTIYVVIDFTNINLTNNSTMNLVQQFENLFSVNGNILTEINNIWTSIKRSKLYLVIFISFVGSIISGIIYLIRRK